MNRRQFLAQSIGTALALGWVARTPVHAESMPMDHSMHMMHGGDAPAMPAMAMPDMPMMNPAGIDLTKLKSGEPLKAFTPIVFNQGKADLMIQPTEQVWLKSGSSTPLWGYSSAGNSLIDATEGDTLSINVMNHLPEDTTVHWHGVDVPSDQDGHPHMPIASNQSHTYQFTLPADSAGTYWYHPHPHKRTSFQAAQGLAAPIIIRSKNDPLTALNIPEQLLFFTAPELDAEGKIAPISMSEQMNGRIGNVVLVNGQYQPVLTVAPNSMHRLRLVNATNARYLRLSFGKTAMVQVGTDGGLLTKPLAPQTELLLAPAERAEVCVTFTEATTLQALYYDKGWMGGGMGWSEPKSDQTHLLAIQLSGDAATPPKLPEQLRPIQALGEPKVTRQFVLGEKMAMSMENGKHSMTMDFLINDKAFDMKRIDFTAKANEVELWEIINNTDMDHPFHIHGSQFQVVSIEENGKVTDFPYLAWKDTVNTKKGQTVRLKIMQDLKGLRMYHCHVLEHEDLGMMGQYNVL
ncbi:multicopper oxidase family protein [Thiofilum flexile]|uniref:multicopper oxidase family protein n=1 Tax=Thiofilum flexile TaxID=125627 RepID=UPI00038081CE|nr:multicopper oxidase family protein [Thiofilum flexile]